MLNTVLLAITESCNSNCKHCRVIKYHSEVDFGKARQIIDKISKETKIINITGGEPLLYPQIFQLIRYIKEKTPLKASLSTNGYLLDKKTAVTLKKLSLDGINISLDSIQPKKHDSFRGKKGAYKLAEKGIKAAIKSGLNCRIACALGKFNYKEVEDLILKACDLGCTAVSFRRILPVSKATSLKPQLLNKKELIYTLKKIYKALTLFYPYLNIYIQEPIDLYLSQKILKRKFSDFGGCSACRTLVDIKTNGDVWPCFALPIKLGNIYRQSLKEILEHPVAKSLISQNLQDNCQKCSLKQICGGCRAWALYKTGDFLATDPFCFKKDCLEIINTLPNFEEKQHLDKKEQRQIISLTTKFMKPILKKSGIAWNSKILENDLKNNKDKFWLLKLKSKLVGYLWFTENNSQIYLKSLIINKPYQKENFGTFLMKRLELYTKKNKEEEIRFAIQTANKKSFKFFTKLGYKKINKDKHKGFIFSKKFNQSALS